VNIVNASQVSCKTDWQFWLGHLLFPLLIAVTLLLTLEFTLVDLWLADRWFAIEGGAWSLMDHWVTYDLIHHYGKRLIISFALILIGLLISSMHFPGLRQWRRPVGYLLICMLVLPATVTKLKHFATVPCPFALARYGGDLMYLHNFQYLFIQNAGGNCYPSGHASGGFALVAMYFATYRNTTRPCLFLLPGFVIGWIFALGQQARGAHFLSHDLASLSICWFGALLLFVLIKPHARFSDN